MPAKLSYQFRIIDEQLELQPEECGRAPVHRHTYEEYLKIVHYRTYLRIDLQDKVTCHFCAVDGEFGFFHRVIDPVMDVERCDIGIRDPAPVHIGLVRK